MGRKVYLDGTALVIRGIEQLIHEVLNVLRRDPRRTQPHVNVGCLQILGLCRFQSRHIGLKGSVRLRSGLGLAQLLPHIAGQVFVCRHILRLGAGDSEDDAGQLMNDVLLAFPGQLGHIAEVNPGALSDGHRQRVGRGVHMIDAALLLDRPLREHIRFSQQLVIIIEDFERAEQVVGGIRRKRKAVGPIIDEAVARRKAVIQSVQLLLKLLNLPVAMLIELRVDQLAHLIPQGNHPLDALLCRLIQVGLHHAAVLTVIDGAVDHRIREVPHIGISGNGLINRFIVAQIGQRCFLIGAVDMANRLMQLIRKARIFLRKNGKALPAVLRILPGQRAQNHLRVLNKVAVHGQAVCVFTHMDPIRLNLDGPIPLLQEDDVRNDLGTRVGAKGIVGQPDRAQQLRPLRDVFTHLRGLLIHRISGGDKGDHAARAHLVDGLGEEVVVNGKTELVVSPVVDLIVAKGHVADGEIEEVTPVRRFKAGDGDVGLGIKLLRDAPGDAVQLHTVQSAGLHSFRQHSEEIADAHGRLQNVAAGKAHLRDSIVHRPDDDGTGVVRVERRGARGLVFLRREDGGKLTVLIGPRRLVGIKGICQTAPAHIAREDLLFIRRCCTSLGFNLLERSDGGKVVAILGLCAALAEMIVRDAEVLHSGGRIAHRCRRILWKTLRITLWMALWIICRRRRFSTDCG